MSAARVSWKRTIVATALSLLYPGSGHAALGQPRRGLIFLSGIAAVAFFQPWIGLLGPPLLILAALTSAVDAFVAARTMERAPPRGLVAALSAIGFAVVILIGAFALRTLWAEPFKASGDNNLPTLRVGDQFYADKRFHLIPGAPAWMNGGALARGDLVVYRPSFSPQVYVGRILALPGQRVALHEGVLFIDGKPDELTPVADKCEPYRDAPAPPHCAQYEERADGRKFRIQLDGDLMIGEPMNAWHPPGANPHAGLSPTDDGELVVDPNHYYVLGDYRTSSLDSREFGAVSWDAIRGRATYIWWSSSPARIGLSLRPASAP